MSAVGFEPTSREWTATWTQRLRPLGHPDDIITCSVAAIKSENDIKCVTSLDGWRKTGMHFFLIFFKCRTSGAP